VIYDEICKKYLEGNSSAIILIDTALGASLDLNYLRSSKDTRLDNLDYYDERQDIDEWVDSLTKVIADLNLQAPMITRLDEIDEIWE
jgi:hypothetical protein